MEYEEVVGALRSNEQPKKIYKGDTLQRHSLFMRGDGGLGREVNLRVDQRRF